jgi:hypothetical protein
VSTYRCVSCGKTGIVNMGVHIGSCNNHPAKFEPEAWSQSGRLSSPDPNILNVPKEELHEPRTDTKTYARLLEIDARDLYHRVRHGVHPKGWDGLIRNLEVGLAEFRALWEIEMKKTEEEEK